MATDATGTPTSPDNIPKFNVNVDAPSGQGTNAMMDAIQTALSARVSKPSGIATGEVPVWNGSTWVRSSTTRIINGGAALPQITVSALSGGPPISPSDADIWIATGVDTNGTRWTFQYNAGSASAYKWEFLGGPPLAAGQSGSISTSSTTYVDLTSGPTLTVPRAGDYIVQVDMFGQCSSFTAAYELRSQAVFSTSGAGAEQVLFVAVAVFNGARAAFTEKRTGLVASETVKLQVRGGATHTSTFNSAYLRLIPIRVS